MDFLTMNEVIAVTKRSRQWVYDRIEDGTFERASVGGRKYIRRDGVMRWLESEVSTLEAQLRHYYEQMEEVLV